MKTILFLAMLQWSLGGGLENSENPSPRLDGGYTWNNGIGWTGQFVTGHENSSIDEYRTLYLKYGKKRLFTSRETHKDVRLSSYGIFTGPSMVLVSRGDTDLGCSGRAGVLKLKAWKFATKNGCWVSYDMDYQVKFRITTDYLYTSHTNNVVIGADILFSFRGF